MILEKNIFNKNNTFGQTTIELLLILSFSLVFLLLIYSLYVEQVENSALDSDFFITKNSVQKIINGVNTAYFSGTGSRIKIVVDFPETLNFSDIVIKDNLISIKSGEGSDILGIADVNIDGSLREQTGRQIIFLFFDGNVVRLQYLDFEISKHNFYFLINPGSIKNDSFSIRNNYSETINFFLEKNFFHDDVSININSVSFPYSFFLKPDEIRTFDLNFVVSNRAFGNHSGLISVIGKVDDINIVKNISVSIESLLLFEELKVYPFLTSFSAKDNEIIQKNFSICNKSVEDITINNWIGFSNPDNNLINLINNWDDLLEINFIEGGSCQNFSIFFETKNKGFFDGNIVLDYDYLTNSKNNIFYIELIVD